MPHEKKFDEKRRYEEIKHIRVCRVRPRGACTLSADLISERALAKSAAHGHRQRARDAGNELCP